DVGKGKLDPNLLQPPRRSFCNLSFDLAYQKRLLIDPRFSRHQLCLSALRLQFQYVTGLTIQNRFAFVAKRVIISIKSGSGLIPAGGSFYFVFQKAPHHFLATVITLRLLNPIIFAGWWPEIYFCNDV